MRLLYDDLGDEVTISASGEASNFPVTNVQHPHLIKRWRTLSVAAEQWVLFDAGPGETIDADTAIIAAHNFTPSAVITVEANSADSWASAPYSATAVYTSAMIVVNASTLQSYRFWRIGITDTSNGDDYIEVGRIGLYDRYQLERVPDKAVEWGIRDSTRTTRSVSQQKYADLGTQARTVTLSMGLMSETVRQGLLAAYGVVGQHTPVVLEVDEDELAKFPPLYCTIEVEPRATHMGGWYWRDTGFTFVEVF